MAITLDGTTGITTPGLTNTGTETLVNLTSTGNTTLGDATTDTLTVGVTGIVKDASGNVGIGTASPSSLGKLAVVGGNIVVNGGGTVDPEFRLSGASGGVTRNYAMGTDTTQKLYWYDYTAAAYRMVIDSSGNVGIGTASPGYALQVGINSTSVAIGGSATSNGTARLKFLSSNTVKNWQISTNDSIAGALEFTPSTAAGGSTFTTPSMLLDTNGNLLVGKTAADTTTAGSAILPAYGGANIPAMTLAGASSSNSQLGYHQYSTSAAAFRFYVGYGGTVYATSTTITAISDQRLKENIRDLDDGLEKVLLLKPRKFDWKEGKGADIKDARGFIAQEFEIVFPDMVEEWKDPAPEGEEPYKAVNANLIPTLVKAIQELNAKFEEYKAAHP